MTFEETQVIVTVNAEELFGEGAGNPNWEYCMEQAPFSHKEACEFIFPISREPQYYALRLGEMGKAGCTLEFAKAYAAAYEAGANWVLFTA